MKVLLAEDNALARKALAAGLAKDGHEVTEAEDGEQALKMAHAIQPDFIISDVLMPQMDGFSLCQAVREDAQLHDTPVIFYSATFLDPEDEALASSVGANGFIHKDTDPESFRRRLRELIKARRGASLPEYEWSPESSEELRRLHAAALIRKLHRKVTELEEERRALGESQRFLNQVVTTIPDVVFVMRLPGLEPSYIAPEAERLIGYSDKELMGKGGHWQTLVYDEDRQRLEEEIAQAVAARKRAVLVARMQHKQGGYRWVEARISPRLDERGEPFELVGSFTDITERREADERLRESERSLKTLMSNLPGMAYRYENSPDWHMVLLSDGAESVTGYRSEELLGNAPQRYKDLIHPEDRESVWEQIQQALDERRQFSLSYRILHHDGSTRWVWERGVGVADEAGVVTSIEGFINDITLRKRAEDELLVSEQRYRHLFEMMASGMSVHELVYDGEGRAVDYRFLDVNPTFERLTGLRKEAIIGRTVREVTPDIEEGWIEDYVRVAQSGEPARFFRYTKALGRYYEVVAYRTEENQFVTLYTDVTEKWHAEEVVRNLARFPEEDPSPVLRVDARGELLYANAACKELLQHCREEGDGKECNDLVAPAMTALQTGVSSSFDYSMADKHYAFVVTPIMEEGYANLYGRDITDRIEINQQLERLNRVLRTLSKGNRSMVYAISEQDLIENICSVLVEEGGYNYVWMASAIGKNTPPQIWSQCGKQHDDLQQWLEEFIASPTLRADIDVSLHDKAPLLVNTSEAGGEVTTTAGGELSVLLLLPIVYQKNRYGVMGIFSETEEVFDPQEMDLLNEMAGDVAYGIQALRTQQAHEKGMVRIQNTMMQTIEAVSLTLEKRDPYTSGHQQRVVQLAVAIANEMGLSKLRIEGLRLGALVHDIGKIYVPAEILNRPGRLSESEFGIIKSHPEVGYDILKGVEFDWPIAEMVLQHHERCDGSGYPRGLKCEEIVLEARILAVADVVEAITSHRPYRPGLGMDIALDEITRGRGTSYDPVVADVCLKLFREKGFAWDTLGALDH